VDGKELARVRGQVRRNTDDGGERLIGLGQMIHGTDTKRVPIPIIDRDRLFGVEAGKALVEETGGKNVDKEGGKMSGAAWGKLGGARRGKYKKTLAVLVSRPGGET